jgi:PII-like signaling protein
MNTQPGKLLRVYVNEHDHYSGKPLHEAIVERCRKMKVAGATVFRALEGFGETTEIHHSHLFRSDLPIVIAIVERPEKAREILPLLEEMMGDGVIAVTDVEVTAVANGRRAVFP